MHLKDRVLSRAHWGNKSPAGISKLCIFPKNWWFIIYYLHLCAHGVYMFVLERVGDGIHMGVEMACSCWVSSLILFSDSVSLYPQPQNMAKRAGQ